jgi:hypothetical protein
MKTWWIHRGVGFPTSRFRRRETEWASLRNGFLPASDLERSKDRAFGFRLASHDLCFDKYRAIVVDVVIGKRLTEEWRNCAGGFMNSELRERYKPGF